MKKEKGGRPMVPKKTTSLARGVNPSRKKEGTPQSWSEKRD